LYDDPSRTIPNRPDFHPNTRRQLRSHPFLDLRSILNLGLTFPASPSLLKSILLGSLDSSSFCRTSPY
jgi:hypothetical protein